MGGTRPRKDGPAIPGNVPVRGCCHKYSIPKIVLLPLCLYNIPFYTPIYEFGSSLYNIIVPTDSIISDMSTGPRYTYSSVRINDEKLKDYNTSEMVVVGFLDVEMDAICGART